MQRFVVVPLVVKHIVGRNKDLLSVNNYAIHGNIK